MTDILKKGSDNNTTVLASSSGSQIIRGSKAGRGYFTYALLKGLSEGLPADASKNGIVEMKEVEDFSFYSE